jgi:hypothetical protein
MARKKEIKMRTSEQKKRGGLRKREEREREREERERERERERIRKYN